MTELAIIQTLAMCLISIGIALIAGSVMSRG